MQFGAVLGTGVTGGVTKWGYIFRKVGLQKWGLRGCDTRGGRYYFFNDTYVFCTDTPPLNATTFCSCTLLNNNISGSLLCLGAKRRGKHQKGGERGGEGGR